MLLEAVGEGLTFLDLASHPAQLLVDQLSCCVQFGCDGGEFSDGHELGVLGFRDVGFQHKRILLLNLVDLMDGLLGGDPVYGRIHHYFLELRLDINGRKDFVVLL